jgi:hypothetical protein
MTRWPLLVFGLAIARATPGVPQTPSAKPDRIALGRQYTQWFYQGQTDSLWSRMEQGVRDQLKTPDEIRRGADELVARAGNEVEVISEKVVKRNGQMQYWRTAKFDRAPEPMMVRWVIGDDGKIIGVGMNPASQAPPIDPDQPPEE